ncbi:MAG: MarR family EPS-associated transcriptional regulator [Deltaproteobacteria bacterium]|nr:MarR family EPS-associated transcriptional regulator [Deltaproteobacteria bacterium]
MTAAQIEHKCLDMATRAAYTVHVMNKSHEEEIRYNILRVLSRESKVTQREMARKMGISLGKVNSCISELVRRGLIKINRFKGARNRFGYIYVLTPRGIEEKAGLTLSFLKRKMLEYTEIKRQVREVAQEAEDGGLADISVAAALDRLKRIS